MTSSCITEVIACPQDVDDDLARARAEFEHWRSHAAGRGRIPSHLWAMALSLVEHHSVATVCGELGLNPGRLRARLNEHARSTPKRRASKPAFVELRPIDVARAARAGAAEGNTAFSLQIKKFYWVKRIYMKHAAAKHFMLTNY